MIGWQCGSVAYTRVANTDIRRGARVRESRAPARTIEQECVRFKSSHHKFLFVHMDMCAHVTLGLVAQVVFLSKTAGTGGFRNTHVTKHGSS